MAFPIPTRLRKTILAAAAAGAALIPLAAPASEPIPEGAATVAVVEPGLGTLVAPAGTAAPPRPEAVVVRFRAGSGAGIGTGREVETGVPAAAETAALAAVPGVRAGTARWLVPRAENGDPALRDGAFARAVAARGLDRVAVVPLAPGTSPAAAAAALAALPEIETAEPVVVYAAAALTDDPFLHSSGSWGESFPDLWGLHTIGAPAAWDVTAGLGAVVAVIDTGCDPAHPDLAPNLWRNPDEIPGNGADDDGNGYADDVAGWDFVRGHGDPRDRHGHGTHVAGTVAAVGDNAEGVVGLAWQARVMALKGLDDGGFGFSDQLAQAILYAAANGADVINMSWGGRFYSQVVDDALAVAHDVDAIPVAAAGNSGGVTDAFHPASSRWVLAVGATGPADERLPFSNSGPGTELMAPGGGPGDGFERYDVLSLRSSEIEGELADADLAVGDGYLRLAGTSMAAPHVAGAAALIRAHFRTSTETARQILRQALVDLGPPGWDPESGYGRLDVGAMFESPVPPALARILAPHPGVLTEDGIPITAIALTGVEGLWVLEAGAGTAPASWTELARGATSAVEEHLPIATWHNAGVPDGVHTLRLRIPLFEVEDRLTVTLDRVAIDTPAPYQAFRAGAPPVIAGQAAGGGFSRFRVEHRPHGETAWSDAGVELAAGGAVAVPEGELASWDTTGLPAGFYEVRLVVERSGLPEIEESVLVIVDPTLHPGWPQRIDIAQEGFHLALTDHLTAADLDRDGAAELLVAYGPEVRIYRGDGSMLPGWPQRVDDLPRTAVQTGPTAADLDGDGDLEVIAGSGSNQLFVWEHDGRRRAPWPQLHGRTAAVADLGPPAGPELVTTYFFQPTMRAFRADGSVVWQRSVPADVLTPPAIGDLDGDSLPELVVAAFDERIELHAFSPGRQLTPGWPVDLGPSGGRAFIRRDAHPSLGDLDGDGLFEVVAIDGDCRVHALDGDGSPLPGWPRPFSATPYDCNSPTLGDLDGDGRVEVVVGGRDLVDPTALGPSKLMVWRADGTPLPGFPVEAPRLGPGYTGFHGFGPVAIADLDGDGRPEMVADRSASSVTPWAVDAFEADGSRVAGFPKPVSAGADWSTNVPAVADLDGDGRAELAWANRRGDVYVWDLPAPELAADWPMHRAGPAQLGARPAALETGPCVEGPDVLCLGDGRFEVRAWWQDFQDGVGHGRALPQTADTGALWFFGPNNVELLVKVLDGSAANGWFWIFFASLSNVQFDVRVRDTATGATRVYRNPSGTFASRADTRAFTGDQPVPPAPPPGHGTGSGTAVSDAAEVLLRDGRFRVAVEWDDGRGGGGAGRGHRLTGDTAVFWFFRPGNLELAVKVLDGRTVNGHHWVFYGSLSNVAYRLRVTDLETGEERVYVNPLGRLGSRGDTRAFPQPSQ